MQFPELGTGIDAKLFRQDAAAFLEDTQCIALAARPVQGQHQLAAQPLPQRIGGHERAQLPDEPGVPAERQLRFRLHLDGAEPLLLEPADLVPGEALRRELGERRAAPQAECLLKQRTARAACPLGPACLASATSRPNRPASTSSGRTSSR